MLPVYVDLPDTLDYQVAETLKKVLRADFCKRFSTPTLKLTQKDIAVMFVPLNRWSEPTHDITVRIQLHHFPERLAHIDQNAEKIAAVISKALSQCIVEKDVQVGVAILAAEIGWGVATVVQNYSKEGKR